MNKPRFFFVLLFVSIAFMLTNSCKQGENSGPTAQFDIKGIEDITIAVYGSRTIDLDVIPKTTAGDTVTLAVSGLPDHITALYSQKAGIAPFSTELTIAAGNGTVLGFYPITITATTRSGITAFPLNLTITEAPECSAVFVGTMAAVDSCFSGPMPSTVAITKVSGYANRLAIANFAGDPTATVYADLTCGNGIVVIPNQVVGTKTIEGIGHFTLSPKKLVLTYTVTSPTIPPFSCTTTIQ